MNVLVCVSLNALVSGRELGSSAQFLVFLFCFLFLFILNIIVPMLHKLGSVSVFIFHTQLLTLLFADFHPL